MEAINTFSLHFLQHLVEKVHILEILSLINHFDTIKQKNLMEESSN